jgi:membrane dipeptidase
MPVDLEDVSKYPNLFAALLEDGWTDEELGKIASGNILRVLEANEKVNIIQSFAP